MFTHAIAFLLGNVLFQQLPLLPNIGWLAITPLVAGIFIRYSIARFVGVFVLGFCWVWYAAFIRLDGMQGFDGGEAELNLRIVSIPSYQNFYTRLDAVVVRDHEVSAGGLSVPDKLRLGLYGEDPQLKLGETIHAGVRLKPLHGYSNPHTFDYERFLFAHGIGATGYIRSWSYVPNAAPNLAQKFRQYVYDKLFAQLSATDNIGAVLALTLGERRYMTRHQWQLLTASGVGHLFAISGLHIALFFVLIYQCVFYLWRKYFLSRCYIATPSMAGGVAFLFAFTYAWLAGFSLPTQRALIMLGCVLFARIVVRQTSLINSLSLALLVVLCLDPFSTLSASFWFSFSAVGGIVVFIQATKTSIKPVRWIGLHLYLPIILLPLSLWFFNQGALLAPIANLFAVPYASFLVLPCVLLATLFSIINEPIAASLVWAADLLLDGFWYAAEFIKNIRLFQWFHKPLWWCYFSAMLGAILIIATCNFYYRVAGVLFLCTLSLIPPPSIPKGAFESVFLDVGQGLAVVIRTRTHTLLFDAGAKYPSGFDLGSAVILPFLLGSNITHLDALVLSHSDKDHAGGADVILSRFDVRKKYIGGRSERNYVFSEFERCHDGIQWVWDDVYFTFLHPSSELLSERLSENDASCVLRISNNDHQLLLTGDIEKSAENQLLRRYSIQLNVDAVSVPHHGSKTSSGVSFIKAVRPKIAIVSSGFRNRFDFPAASVVQRYRDHCVSVYNTAESGAIRLYFPPDSLAGSATDALLNDEIQVTSHRAVQKHYWQTHKITQENHPDCV